MHNADINEFEEQMNIDFAGFAGDCLVRGQLEVGSERLTDHLNGSPVYTLRDAQLESLDDGHTVFVEEVQLERDELYAVEGTGTRGMQGRRIYTVRHRLVIHCGPYTVTGNLHTTPGGLPLGAVGLRRAMVPLTDATIAYLRTGELRTHQAATLIVNGHLVDSVRTNDGEEAAAPSLYGAQRA
ncbi:MAG: hypothetical protein H0V12_12685 [Chloroflexi bacterium]|nr:hypothetical protein [Chloroflexota bacterium]